MQIILSEKEYTELKAAADASSIAKMSVVKPALDFYRARLGDEIVARLKKYGNSLSFGISFEILSTVLKDSKQAAWEKTVAELDKPVQPS